MLHAASNITASNKNFEHKKNEYKQIKYVKLPQNNDVNIGLDLYDDFDYKDIINRSLRIVNCITSKFYSEWDQIE